MKLLINFMVFFYKDNLDFKVFFLLLFLDEVFDVWFKICGNRNKGGK